MANVKVRLELNARVCVINNVTAHTTHGPKEGAQWHNIHHCVTRSIDSNEWKWRYATAKAVLCFGTAPYGTTYGGAIGSAWM
jgi:hypothetical protein